MSALRSPRAQSRGQTVFITGATGGIGRALVQRFLRDGWTVFAGCLEGAPADPGVIHVPLDVTSDASVQAARAQVGVPDLLINNAGIGLLGPMAELPDEVLTRQFDVNVRGLARVTRAFAPDMCRRRQGRIINISSLVGVFTLPWFGAYAATKHAVEAMSDALRMELAPFGVRVSIVEPSIVGTAFVDNAVVSLQRAARSSLWTDALEETVARRGFMSPVQIHPAQVAAVVLRAAHARSPSARYRVGALASLLLRLGGLLPVSLLDVLLRSLTGLSAKRPVHPRLTQETQP